YVPSRNWNSPAHHTVETLSVSTYENNAEEFSTPPSTLLIRVIPVNDPPSLRGPSEILVLESRSTVLEGIVMEDMDAHESHGVVQVNVSVGEEGSLVELGTNVGLYVTESLPRSKTFLGSVRNVNSALAGLTYRGPPQFSGGDELLVTVDDRGNTGEGGVLSASLIVPINVRSVNDPPRVTRDSDTFLHGTEDESLWIKGVGVGDADAGNKSVKLTLEPRYGTITLRTDGLQLDFQEGRRQLDARTTIVGTLEVLNLALQGLLYTPDPDSNALNTDGLASVTIIADDLGFSGGGGAQESEPLTIRIIVNAVNDKPLLDLPVRLMATEDMPIRVPALRVSDVDVNEPGGES
ncbi:unnamed protein product, partial [Sphacelaria rigidula]